MIFDYCVSIYRQGDEMTKHINKRVSEFTMRTRLFCQQSMRISAIALALSASMHAVAAGVNPSDAALDVVRRHVEAQRTFDVTAIKALTADNYVEVSPIGELDSREKMLGFYAVDKKSESPAIQVEDAVTRLSGDTAIVVAKLAYSMTAGGQPRSFAMRATFVAQKSNGSWKLLSAHYTAIRPAKAPG